MVVSLLRSSLEKAVRLILQGLVAAYRVALSPWLGGACRFEPSCSCYAEKALQIWPAHKALVLILRRLGKCHPWGPFGFDDVPERLVGSDSRMDNHRVENRVDNKR